MYYNVSRFVLRGVKSINTRMNLLELFSRITLLYRQCGQLYLGIAWKQLETTSKVQWFRFHLFMKIDKSKSIRATRNL